MPLRVVFGCHTWKVILVLKFKKYISKSTVSVSAICGIWSIPIGEYLGIDIGESFGIGAALNKITKKKCSSEILIFVLSRSAPSVSELHVSCMLII